jgi:branched-chain amino acid transport system permease protein
VAYQISLLTIVGISVIWALSLNIITGFCGQISLGHAAFYGAGAYCAALLAKAGAPFALALLAGGLLAGAVGVVVGLASLRVRHDFLAITTMGVSFLFLGIVRQQDALGAEMGIAGIPDPGLGKPGYMLLVLAIAALVAAFSVYLRRSWLGFAFTGVADDEDAASLVGIDVARFKIAAFAIGTAIAGVAGGLHAHDVRFIDPDSFGFVESITVLAMVVVGGIGSVWGVALAAAVLSVLPLLVQFISDYKLLLYGGLLFAMMRFCPGGLAGLLATVRRAGCGR